MPNYLGHSDNYIEANALVTPASITPEWYFWPFYAILRAIPDKLGGVVAMVAAILILLGLPFFDRSIIHSPRFAPLYQILFSFFVLDVVLLAWLGSCPAEEPYISLGQKCTLFYFLYFLFFLPLCNYIENYMIFGFKKTQPFVKWTFYVKGWVYNFNVLRYAPWIEVKANCYFLRQDEYIKFPEIRRT